MMFINFASSRARKNENICRKFSFSMDTLQFNPVKGLNLTVRDKCVSGIDSF